MNTTVRHILIMMKRDELDPCHSIPDDRWLAAFNEYRRIISKAVWAMFPYVDVEVIEGDSLRKVAAAGYGLINIEAEQQVKNMLGDAALCWNEWLKKQEWY